MLFRSIQAIKAGILEVADILVVNKADREGADRTRQDLLYMLDLQTHRKTRDWQAPVLLVQAKDNQGVEDLLGQIQAHLQFLAQDQGQARNAARYERARQEFLELLKEGFFRQLLKEIEHDGRLARTLRQIAARDTDPYSASEALVREIFPD